MTEIHADTIVWHGSGQTQADPYTWHDVSDMIDRTQVPRLRPNPAWEGSAPTGYGGDFPGWILTASGTMDVDVAAGSQVWFFGDASVEHMDLRSEPSFLDRLKSWIGL